MFKRTQADMERVVKAEMMGLDPDQTSAVPDRRPSRCPRPAAAEKSPSKPSKASSLYGIVDEEEEDEE